MHVCIAALFTAIGAKYQGLNFWFFVVGQLCLANRKRQLTNDRTSAIALLGAVGYLSTIGRPWVSMSNSSRRSCSSAVTVSRSTTFLTLTSSRTTASLWMSGVSS
jgi:hypothetical protein